MRGSGHVCLGVGLGGVWGVLGSDWHPSGGTANRSTAALTMRIRPILKSVCMC